LCLDLPSEKSSVGIEMNVSHDAPSPLGALIEIEAKISADLGKIIEFEVAAYMGDKCIGKGVHKRAIINIERFMGRVQG
jgi:predicted thioesterase